MITRVFRTLLSFDFSFFFSSEDIDFLWESLKCIIHDACVRFIPKSLRSTRYPKWFTGTIKHQLHLTRSLHKKMKNPSAENAASLEQFEVSLQEAILSARSQYEIDLVNDCAFGDNERIFQYINPVLNQHSLLDTMTLDSSSESSDFRRATLFNQFFHSVFSFSGPFPDPSSLPPPSCFFTGQVGNYCPLCVCRSLSSQFQKVCRN